MREIKFRVYDIDGNKMSEGFNIGATIIGELDIEFLAANESLPWKDFLFFRKEYSDLLLFTGLKDKNGKEIYEGDIVKFEREHYGEILQEVKFIRGMFSPLVYVEDGHNAIDKFHPQDFEIVGNIYENPELLIGKPDDE